jgi:hypothetical protein
MSAHCCIKLDLFINNDNEHYSTIKYGEFFDWLFTKLFLKEVSADCS